MKEFELNKAFTLLEPGPVALLSTSNEGKYNIMTFSWHMVLDYTPRFALMTGPWNYSYEALMKNKECVIAIPTVDMIEKVVQIGTNTGADMDKFSEFELKPLKGKNVDAPLIKECFANIECKIVDYIEKYSIFILDACYSWINMYHKEKRTFHYKGDGTFIVDGDHLNYKKKLESKMPPGVF